MRAATLALFLGLALAAPGGAATLTHSSEADFLKGVFAGLGSQVGSAGDVRMGLRGITTTAAWATTTGMPAARAQLAAAAYNGRVYVSGGAAGTSYFSTVWSAPFNADGSLGSWTAHTGLPATRRQHAMTAFNGRLYVSGGYSNDVSSVSALVWSAPVDSDGSLGSWTALTPLPASRRGHTMHAHNGRLYVVAGVGNSNALSDTVWSAPVNGDGSLGAWVAETPLPATRADHASAILDGRIFVSGGYGGPAPIQTRGTVYRATIAASGSVGAWSSLGDMTYFRDKHSMTAWNGRLYLVGGQEQGGINMDIPMSSAVNSNGSLAGWVSNAPHYLVKYYHGAVAWNGWLYVIGGTSFNGTTTVHRAPIGIEQSGATPLYSLSGTYYGPVTDFGGPATLNTLSWTQSAAPAGSAVTVSVATALNPGDPLTNWTPAVNGGPLGLSARYFSYRIDMSPGGGVGSPPRDESPVLDEISLDHIPPTATPTGTISPTFSHSSTPTPSSTASPTATSTPTATPSSTPAGSPTNTPSSTPSFTATRTGSPTPTFTATPTASPTASPTATRSATASFTSSSTPTFTASPTATPSSTQTPDWTATPTRTVTATPAFRASNLGRVALGPVPAKKGQPLCLHFESAPQSGGWTLYTSAGERAVGLNFGPEEDHCLDTAKLAPGVYFVIGSIRDLGGEKGFRQKIMLLP